MLKKIYKPSKINRWYTRVFVIYPLLRDIGAFRDDRQEVWWCFLAHYLHSWNFTMVETSGRSGSAMQFVIYENGKSFRFHAHADVVQFQLGGFLKGKVFKEINGVVYEITYDTPIP